MKLFLLFLFAALTASAEIVGIGANSGIEGGKGIPGGLQLQCEGRDIHYGNIWIEELYFGDKGTDF